MPSALHRFSVRPVAQSVNSANGTAIGSTSMITIGCTKLSNCDASTM